jgi:hypothetical protein
MTSPIDPIAELARLKQKQLEQTEAHKREMAAAQARVAELCALQHPLNELHQKWLLKHRAAKHIAALIAAFDSDAQKLREMLSEEIGRVSPDYRGGLLARYGQLTQTEGTKAECERNLAAVKDEMEDLVARGTDYAERHNLKAMLTSIFQPETD